jgi:CelD/BcsL family acetyltransferase involved in cellulose biosynthesis
MTSTTVSVHTDPACLPELRTDWTDLHHSSGATPFQSWEWVTSWWHAYGAERALRVVEVREAGELIGLLPLMVEGGRSLRRLRFIGTGISDHLDVLARADRHAEVGVAGARCLMDMGDWHVADLQEVRPDAAAWHLHRAWSRFSSSLEQSRCPVVDVRPWEDALSSLTRNQRGQARKTMRRLERDGITIRRVAPAAAGPAVARFLELHRGYWRDRRISPEHESSRFQAHIERFVSLLSADGPGGLYEYVDADGDVVAGDLVLVGPGFVGEYLSGMTDYVRGRFDFQTLLVHLLLDVAHEVGVRQISLLRGEEPAKLRWNTGTVVNARVVLARRAALGGGYAGYHRLRLAAAGTVRGLRERARRR